MNKTQIKVFNNEDDVNTFLSHKGVDGKFYGEYVDLKVFNRDYMGIVYVLIYNIKN